MKKIIRKILLSVPLLMSSINLVYSAHEGSLQHELLKQNFKLATFMALPADPQRYILNYVYSNSNHFIEDLHKMWTRKFRIAPKKYRLSNRLTEIIVAQILYDYIQDPSLNNMRMKKHLNSYVYKTAQTFLVDDRFVKDIVDIFFQLGADLNSVDAENKTVLHYAGINDHLALVEYLLKQGADYKHRDNSGCILSETALGVSRTIIKKFEMEQSIKKNQRCSIS